MILDSGLLFWGPPCIHHLLVRLNQYVHTVKHIFFIYTIENIREPINKYIHKTQQTQQANNAFRQWEAY